MRVLLLPAILALSACSPDQAGEIAAASTTCIDNVEYLTFSTYGGSRGLTPHLKPDGRPYQCSGGTLTRESTPMEIVPIAE